MFEFLWWLVIALLFAGQPGAFSSSAAGNAPIDRAQSDAAFTLAPGVTWVHRLDAYDLSTLRPQETVTATYVLTETVVELIDDGSLIRARVQTTKTLLDAEPGYPEPGGETLPDFWYILDGDRLLMAAGAAARPDSAPEAASLLYPLPLAVGDAWCALPGGGDDASLCNGAGMRHVVAQESFTTPAGVFADCYQTYESYLSGSPITWFCTSIGVVAEQYDHIGAPFGYQKTLIEYRILPE